MQCEQNTRVNPAQQQTLRGLERHLRALIIHLRKIDEFEPTWALLEEQWRGRVLLGTTRLNVPLYAKETGCLTIALDSNGSRDLLPRLLGRCILVLVKETMDVSACAQQMRRAIEVAESMEMSIDLSCDDIKAYGLVQTGWYKEKQCGTTSYDHRRWTFEELLGHDVDEAVHMLRNTYPDLHIVTRGWDMIHQAGTYDLHPEKETVVISYDMKSNKVVLPVPQLTSLQPMDGVRGNCFMLPEEGRCMGAPATVPGTWEMLIGKNLMDATDSLRFNYPHAQVETVPNTYGIPPVKRRDRIRVLFDPKTGRTTQIILG